MGIGSLFWIFFVYGLAFLGMGLAMAMEVWRSSALAEARVLLPLAGFGIIHGVHEWLEAYLMQAQALGAVTPAWMPGLRLGLLIASFLSLSAFAFQSLHLLNSPLPSGLKYAGLFVGVYLLFILASAALTYEHHLAQIQDVLDAAARYVLAVPSSILAALGLHYMGRNNPGAKRSLVHWTDGAALGLGLYGLTQFFVAPVAMFPANLVNTDAFRAATGLPIQVVRTLAGVIIAVCILRVVKITEDLRRAELLASQQARLDALAQKESLRRELLRHTVHAQEDERARIARELHDETAQTLTAFSLELATLRNRLPRRSASSQTVERLLDLSRQMSEGLYHIMTGLRPTQLDELGLAQAIQTLVERDFKPNGFDFPIEVTGAPRRLDSVTATVLFRVAQEALTNVTRHSGVREGCVQICFEAGQVVLRVSDRGCGFNPVENFHPPRGWGLEGMKDRVESVGGSLNIESTPGTGAVIEARIPTS